MKRPGPTTIALVAGNENSSNNNHQAIITYSVINKPAAITIANKVINNQQNDAMIASSPRTINNNNAGVTFRDADLAPAGGLQVAASRHQAPSSSPHLLRYRRGVSLMSLNVQSSSMSSQDVKSLREALVRHDASLNRAGAAVNHLSPVDRHALTARSHFRPDPSSDVLAQHLRWSTNPTASVSSGNPGFPENEVLAAARETYHPIAPPVPQMQISIKQITKSSSNNQQQSPQQSPTPGNTSSSAHNHPVLLLQERSNSGRIVSIDNRPATTSSTLHHNNNNNNRQHPSSAMSSASTTRILPGSADLRKQFDVYQRGTPFLPHQSSTKYFYKPEHGWLVKSVRERRSNNTISASGGSGNNNNNNNTSSPQPPLDQQLLLNSSLEVNKVNPTVSSSTPEPIRSSTANVTTRLSQNRLISVNKAPASAIPHVSVVDLNAEHEIVEGGNNNSNSNNNNTNNPLKIMAANTGAVINPLRTSVMTKKMHLQQQQQASILHIDSSPIPQPRVSSSGPQPSVSQAMIVTSQQHPAAQRAKKLRDLFASYDDFKRAAEDYASNFPKLPQDLTSSPYLNEAKQRQIWCWLHYGENISDVEYLLSVC